MVSEAILDHSRLIVAQNLSFIFDLEEIVDM